ncbi:CDP-alcohol phosphatidyltransferase family protein [Enterococcus faecium]|uniref:CDP-alcohol phosphatidyltransferase family protein n=1 Tax=Enterococcus faecium TaxID=1352 RepID=UPI00296B015D|nr:CDP-alcohol phosphatidyltransferase family protein [Enterococcus faecium]MDW3709245.1 CDP-alcohol phosphatidyltransferase family protein [Enterococcus faecium]
MITVKEIEMKTMSPEKKKSAKNDYFAFYVGRPLSYALTIPFLYTNITPNTVSILSIIPLIIGSFLMYIGKEKAILIVGWLMFFLWNLLDGVDGNIARYKKQFSPMGSVYDAMSGYVAMVLSFFAWGIAASHNGGYLHLVIDIPADIYVILGALSGIFVIFPRFIMHKAITTLGDANSMNSVKDKSEYGFVKLVALNLTSIAGFVQVIMLFAILFNLLDVFTIGYFILNFMVMIVSLRSIFKSK